LPSLLSARTLCSASHIPVKQMAAPQDGHSQNRRIFYHS